MEIGKNTKAVLAVTLSYIIWGLSFMFSKIGLNNTTPFSLLSLRFGIAFLGMNLIMVVRKRRICVKREDIIPLLLIGFFKPLLYFVCESYGIMYTTAVFSSVIIATIPIATMFFSMVFLKERVTIYQYLFSILSIIGVIVMAVNGGGSGSVSIKGTLLLFGAVLSAVGFFLVSRKNSERLSAFDRTYFMFLLAFVFFTSLALTENGGSFVKIIVSLKNTQVLVSVLYLGLISSVVAFLSLNYAIGILPVAKTTAFANIITVVSLAAGVIILKERLNIISILASVAILVGVWGVQSFSVKE